MFTLPTGLMRYLLLGLALLALLALIVGGVQSCKQIDQANDNQLVNAGATSERATSQAEVLNHVEQAQTATRAPTPVQLDRVCAKYDRNCAHRGK